MRFKTIISGIIGFSGSYFALMRLLYDAAPATILDEWSRPLWAGIIDDKWAQIIALTFAALSIFVGAWLAAAWNKARHWKESLKFGINAGLISGTLSFNFVGAPWAGLVAQREVLEAANIRLTEMEGGRILVNAFSNTIQQTYSVFWLFLIPAIILGALGGLLYALDIQPEEKERGPHQRGWLFRLPAYTLTISGIASFILMYAILALLSEKIAEAAIDFNAATDIPANMLPIFASIIVTPFFAIPALITSIWAIKGWLAGKKGVTLFIIWILFLFTLTYSFAADTLRFFYSLIQIGLTSILLKLLGVTILVVLSLWFLSDEPAEDKRKFTFTEWLGYLLTQGILGGTQVFASSAAFALSLVVITIPNIPHLMSTPSDTPIDPPVRLVKSLFGTLQNAALGVIVGMIILAAILGGLTVFVRGIFGMNKRMPLPQEKAQEDEWKVEDLYTN